VSIVIFLDCGAPSLYNKLSRKVDNAHKTVMGSHIRNRKRDDFSYVKTREYKLYRQKFIDYVKENKKVLSTYPNLDVINNAELTYENQKFMEKQGLEPCPVWHLGSDESWLQKYIAEGYDYICMGGMVPNSKAVLRPALDSLWRRTLTDDAGMPKVKIHGFAMTSFDLMYRYPWYSVDSKSWIDIATFGGILVPAYLSNGERDWLHPRKVHVTSRSVKGGSRASIHHFRTTQHGVREGVLLYLKEIGIPFVKSEFKKVDEGYELDEKEQWANKEHTEVEIEVVKGVSNNVTLRLDVNMQCYKEIEKIVPEWPWKLPRSIKRGKRGILY
jgi:hypothetical protein